MKCCARVLCGWECLCEVLLEHGAGSGEHADKQSRRCRLPILSAAAMLLVRLLGIWHKRRGTPPPRARWGLGADTVDGCVMRGGTWVWISLTGF